MQYEHQTQTTCDTIKLFQINNKQSNVGHCLSKYGQMASNTIHNGGTKAIYI